jgi:hypothetical protein
MKSLKTAGLPSPLLFIILHVSDYPKLKQSIVIKYGNDASILNIWIKPGT